MPRSSPRRGGSPPLPLPFGHTGLLLNHEVGARGAGSGERGRARSSRPAAPASLASPVASRFPNHKLGALGVGSGERGRTRSSGPAAPVSLASPVAHLLPSYEVGARRADSPSTTSRSSASGKAASTSSSASTSQTGVCADDEGADAKEVPSFLIRGRLRSLQ
ncbi:hypothetical protein VPH35_008154 [Triticum aestivum]